MSQTSTRVKVPRPARFWVVWGVALVLIVIGEGFRWSNPGARTFALTEQLCGPEADWLPYLPAMILGLVTLGIGSQKSRGAGATDVVSGSVPQLSTLNPQPSSSMGLAPLRPPVPSAILTLAIGLLAFAVAATTGWSQRDLPPAYHDEYSYLFQTHTFLAGRTWFPSFEMMPQIFDQVHVLNEGRFASRYFPGAGMWFMVFHGIGPIWGQWFAQSITAVGVCLAANHIAGRTAGLIAGLAAALGPGLVLFSQLYLAHHPTLVGLTLFLVMFLRLKWHCEHGHIIRRKDRVGVLTLSFATGLGLSYAMLCRPMTAAGIGFPFGVWLLWWAGKQVRGERLGKRGPETSLTTLEGSDKYQVPSAKDSSIPLPITHYSPRPLPILISMAIPILAGIGLQLIYNLSITGRALESPYQLYTDTYTPRHVYGFNNVVRGEKHLGPEVLDTYDRWAENLTLPLSIRKLGIRLRESGRWTLGLVPLACVVAMLICRWRSWSSDFKLVVASILSLHVAHLPYWFEGIMGWHYVFETAPLWAVVLGVVTADFFRWCWESGYPATRWWWSGMLVTSLLVSWFSVPGLWTARIQRGLGEVAFSRLRYQQFDELVSANVTAPAIVFIQHNPDEVHIDYVNNTPELDGPILKARAPAEAYQLHRAASLFPDRTVWLFDVKSKQLKKLTEVQ